MFYQDACDKSRLVKKVSEEGNQFKVKVYFKQGDIRKRDPVYFGETLLPKSLFTDVLAKDINFRIGFSPWNKADEVQELNVNDMKQLALLEKQRKIRKGELEEEEFDYSDEYDD